MTTATKQDPIERAKELQSQASLALSRAFDELCDAQNLLTDVEGNGSADIYSEIADAYQHVAQLRDKVQALKPTGLFE